MAGLLNSAAYLEANPDVARAVAAGQFENAAHHYALYGAAEQRSWGGDNVSGQQAANSLSNFAADMGGASNTYLNTYDDVEKWANQAVQAGQYGSAADAANAHYQQFGKNENRLFGVNLSPDQQAAYYANRPDVAAAVNRGDFGGYAGQGAEQHFNQYGWNEGMAGLLDNRDFGADAKSKGSAYLAANPDLTTDTWGLTPYDHYRMYGQGEGRTWGALETLTFDAETGKWANSAGQAFAAPPGAAEAYYSKYKAEIDRSGLTPKDYFLQIGKYAGHDFGVKTVDPKPVTERLNETYQPIGGQYKPNLTQGVDYNTMTIEGRINGLMQSPVVRQAGDRAMAAFAGRGLLNSSMAIEAANEAMISKAIEIAGPDAATYFKQSNINQDATNQFARDWTQQSYGLQTIDAQSAARLKETDSQSAAGLKELETKYNFDARSQANEFDQTLRTNYLTAIDNLRKDYANAITNVQIQQMDSAEKTLMIQQYENAMATQINLTNASFSRMPGWKTEWAVLMKEVGELDKPASIEQTAAAEPDPVVTGPIDNGGG